MAHARVSLIMLSVRQSIVNRRIKPSTITNAETIDKEYDKELTALHRNQKRHAWKEAEVRQAVSPQKHETLRRQADLRAAMQEQLRLKEEERRELAENERRFERYNEYMRRSSGPHSAAEDLARQQNKKNYLKSVMNENIQLSLMKKEMQWKEKQLEEEMDRIRVTVPSTWNKRHYL